MSLNCPFCHSSDIMLIEVNTQQSNTALFSLASPAALGALGTTVAKSFNFPPIVGGVESLIYQNQKAYYEALQASTDRTDSAPFIEFILQMILDAILDSTQSAQDSDHATAQAGVQVSDQVQRLISAMKQEDYTLAELMQLVGLTYRATFQKNYLNPAIEADLIKRTIPDKPKSPKQRYRLNKVV